MRPAMRFARASADGRGMSVSMTAEGAPLCFTSLIFSIGAKSLRASRMLSSVTSSGRFPITIRMSHCSKACRAQQWDQGPMPDRQGDLTRIVLAVLFLGGLIAASLWILQPFLGALIWAVMIVVPTWPAMLRVQKALGGRRWAAVTVMSLALLALLIVPLFAAVGTVVAHAGAIGEWAKQLHEVKLPPPPAWVATLPLVGERLAELWRDAVTDGLESLVSEAAPYARAVGTWLLGKVGGLGAIFLQFLLTV